MTPQPSRPGRRGFTLLELLLSISITGIIAVMAYAAADVGLSAGERVVHHRATAESDALLRTILIDALRHAVDGTGPADTVFTVRRGWSRSGLPADTVIFRTRGVPPVLGGAYEWQVMVWPEPSGLVLIAESMEGSMPRLRTRVDAVRGFAVRVRSAADTAWTTSWEATGITPSALEARLFDAQGRPSGGALVVRVGRAAVP